MLACRAVRFLVGVALVAGVGCASEQVNSTSTVAPGTEAAAVVGTQPPSATSPGAEVSAVVSIAFVGDLMFARDVVTVMETDGAAYPFERVGTLLGGTDLLVGNLEGTFTDRGEALEKTYAFRAPPALIETLRLAGFDAVSLANNHALDFGTVGLDDTTAALASVGLGWFGAGDTASEAMAPLILDGGGVTVALLGFSEVADSNFATSGQAGVARAELDSIREAVSEAQVLADYVVVMMHFGSEYVSMPTEAQQALARAAIDAGAVAVVGSHSHVLQPWERYGGGVIVYGLGNFVFDLDREDLEVLGEGPFATAVLVLGLSEGAEPNVAFKPAYIDVDESRPRPASAAEAERIRSALLELGGD